MGFTISNYSLFGLHPQNFYVSIHGTFQIRKDLNFQDIPGCYVVIYTVYYHAAVNLPSITQKDACFSIEQLPDPANIYPMIYDTIKKTLDPQYKTDEQTLVFTDY
jgi:hypothetical protein